MTSIGSTHFLDNIELLPDEEVVWEGGASKCGIAIQFMHLIGLLLAIVIGLSIPFGLPKLLIVDNPDYVDHQDKNDTEKIDDLNILSNNKIKKVENLKQPPTILNTQGLVKLIAIGGSLFILISIGLAWLRIKNYWYVVTNERICIQTGILSRQTVAIDIDKVVSVISTHTILDRLFKLHSVEVVHSGLSSLRANNGLVLFNPYKMQYIPTGLDLTSKLLHSWLPRDNHTNI